MIDCESGPWTSWSMALNIKSGEQLHSWAYL